jgi:hypothetical protein
MYYLDNNMSLCEANETTVYRVYGGNSSLEGGYVTCEQPQNPIQARSDYALSQHDFLDDEGMPMRNMASQVATGRIFTDDDNHIINPTNGEVTDSVLEFQTVEPTSDQPGGGLEYALEDNFSDVVQVESVRDLRHQPTNGWMNYLSAEEEILSNIEGADSDNASDVSSEEDTTDNQMIDALLDDEGYDIQQEDTNSLYDEVQWTDSDDEGRSERSLDEELYGSTTDHADESLDDLIDDELYDIQAEDVADSWSDSDDYENTVFQNDDNTIDD